MADFRPKGLRWRAHPLFIYSTVAIGQFSHIFTYGMVVPILPYLLRDQLELPIKIIQSRVALLLAAFSTSSLIFALPAGYWVDWTVTRQVPYLIGLAALTVATIIFGYAQNFALLLVSRVLQGLSGAVVAAAGLAMVSDTTGDQNLGKTLGSIHAFVAVAELGSPPLGGVLFAKTGREGLLVASMAVLAVDFIMRLLVVETKIARAYTTPRENLPSRGQQNAHNERPEHSCDDGEATEEEPLIPKNVSKGSKSERSTMPLAIIHCLTQKRLMVSLLLIFVQALIIGSYDATLATEAAAEFGFSSLQTGFLFLAIGLPSLLFTPLGGWGVDRYGTRFVATAGFGLFAPCLAFLRLPGQSTFDPSQRIALFCLVLTSNGICLSLISTAGFVEAKRVIDAVSAAKPGFFGPNGGYGQLFGLTTLVFNLGLTLGPLCCGPLREFLGYGNMYGIVALLSATAASLSFIFIGEQPKI